MRSAVAFAVVLQLVLAVASVKQAYAGCNLIPGTAKTFNATLGATNRPFAAPGERLEVTLRSCDPGTLVPTPTPVPTDNVVTVIFQPPSGAKNAVILTAAADCSAINPQLAGCATQLGGGTATCLAGTQAGVEIVDHDGQPFLSFLFPDTRSTCSGGANNGKRCT